MAALWKQHFIVILKYWALMSTYIFIKKKKNRICANKLLSAQKGMYPSSIRCYQLSTRSTTAGHMWTWHWQQWVPSAGPLPVSKQGCCGIFHICVFCHWKFRSADNLVLKKITESEIILKVACRVVMLKKPECWVHFPHLKAFFGRIWNLDLHSHLRASTVFLICLCRHVA